MTDGVHAAKYGQRSSTVWAGHRRQTRLAWSLALTTALLLPVAAHAATPVATANFHTIGLYWYRTQNPAGVMIQYRLAGTLDRVATDYEASDERAAAKYRGVWDVK